MTSQTVKAMFATYGLKVRVRDLGSKFRVCGFKGEFKMLATQAAVDLGLTDVYGAVGGMWNGSVEFIGYKPGSIVRI